MAFNKCCSAKKHISLYVAAQKNGIELPKLYENRLGKVNNGKNCIRFTKLENVIITELKNTIIDAIEWSEEQEKLYGRNCLQPK